MARMDQFLRSLPKAELHVHLEGSLDADTLMELNTRITRREVAERYNYRDFNGFLQAYKWVNGFLREPEHYALALRRLAGRLASEGVVEAEVNLSIGVLLWRNMPFEPFFEALELEAARSPIPIRFVFDAVRQFGLEPAWSVARRAVECRGRGVVGFGIGGDELAAPVRDFHEVFQYARTNGLHVLPHAGETDGPGSVWGALECGAARIGHGIRSIDDPALVRHLAERQVPLEVSISSNVCTGAVASLEEHPVRRLWDAGVPIILNTDDPPMFHTTLLREYEIAARHFGFNEGELRRLAENSLRFCLRS